MIKRQTCPVCNANLPVDALNILPTFPFCTVRCQQVDLYRWCEGKYAIVEELAPEIAQELQAMQDFENHHPADEDEG